MSSDRDRILEQALKHELKGAGTPPAGACLDAETLGAWADGGLDPVAMVACEAHVANCARCQALAGTLARSIPVSTEGTLGTQGTPGTLSLWKWWLAPLAAGVTAVTLWTVIPEQQQIAQAPPQAKDARAVQPPFAPEAVAPAPHSPAAAPEQFGARDNLAAASRDDRQREQNKEERKEERPARVQERAALADTAAPSPPSPPAPAAAPPPAAVALEAPAIGGLRKSVGQESAAIEIATLDPALGWRIVGDRIERSDDAGKTWTMKLQNRGDGIVAGSAPSNTVCWFVGSAGRVLLTVNAGATFVDVSLAEPLDLASVAAIDARNATVFSVIGRRFRTDDGGRTWRPF